MIKELTVMYPRFSHAHKFSYAAKSIHERMYFDATFLANPSLVLRPTPLKISLNNLMVVLSIIFKFRMLLKNQAVFKQT